MSNELEALFADKMTLIHRYLVKMGCSHVDAEDVVQSTFVKALIYLESIDASKLVSWLFRVALNHYYDLCREKSRHPLASLDIETLSDNMLAEHGPPEQHCLDDETKKHVSRVLAKMNPVYKNLLILKYDLGLSYREIAEMLDINERTVKTYLYRARQVFRHIWRADYE